MESTKTRSGLPVTETKQMKAGAKKDTITTGRPPPALLYIDVHVDALVGAFLGGLLGLEKVRQR